MFLAMLQKHQAGRRSATGRSIPGLTAKQGLISNSLRSFMHQILVKSTTKIVKFRRFQQCIKMSQRHQTHSSQLLNQKFIFEHFFLPSQIKKDYCAVCNSHTCSAHRCKAFCESSSGNFFELALADNASDSCSIAKAPLFTSVSLLLNQASFTFLK